MAAPADAERPRRRCVATGQVDAAERLVRFVAGPDGMVVPDVENRLPGRGIWLSARRSVVNTACARRLFSRAARAPLAAPADLADRVEALLTRRCMDLVGLARRSGDLVAGYEKVRSRLTQGGGGLFLTAADGAPGSRAKMRALAPTLPEVAVLRAEELGRAAGRDRVVHALVAPGGLADRLTIECGRLAGFREAAPGEESGTDPDGIRT